MANKQLFSTEQRIFIYESYVLTQSATKVRRRFEKRFPGVKIPSRATVHNLYNKFRATGSVEPKRQTRSRSVLTEEELDDIGYRLEQSPGKSLRSLSQEVGISYGSVQKATKLLKLDPCRLSKTQPGNPTHKQTVPTPPSIKLVSK